MINETKDYKGHLQKKYMPNRKDLRVSNIPRNEISKTRRCIKHLRYRGKELGMVVTETRSYLDEQEIRDLICSMSSYDKIHMEECAYPVHLICKVHEIIPEEYLSNEEIMIYVADEGYRNSTELKHNDCKTFKLIKKRGLEDEVFQDFLTPKE